MPNQFNANKQNFRRLGETGNALVIVIVVAVLALGVYLLWISPKSGQEAGNGDKAESMANDENAGPAMLNENAGNKDGSADMMDNGAEIKSFILAAKNFSFTPAEITVKKGDKIRLTLSVESGFHDWVLDEFNVRTKQMMGPATETIEFTADKTGTFEYYCSVGNHRAMGMKGNLIVE